MMAGFAIVGQSSTVSGTPSTSRSSFTVLQVPVLATEVFWQVSPPQTSFTPPRHWALVVQLFPERRQVKMQLQFPLLLVQVLFTFSRQRPLMVVHWASVEQICELVRLHEPLARTTGPALEQSPSQASPIPSLSESCWVGFGVLTQLSTLSLIVSP